jgi:DNA-directed RNA polymerase specialized sigma24 family protein
MPRQHSEPARFEPAALATALAAATARARSLRRSLKAPAADEDDFRQAILLDLIGRAERFDPNRGAWGAFVSVVTRHAAARIAHHQLRHAQATTWLSEDHDVADDSHRIDGIDLGLDLQRSCNRLPRRLKGLVGLIVETGSIADAQRESVLSPASFYRALAELRLRFLADDLAPNHRLGRLASPLGRSLA